MKSLHDYLCQRAISYREWHNHPLANATHWSAFIAISLVMAASLLSSISAYAQTVDDQASSTIDTSTNVVPVDTVVATTTSEASSTMTIATNNASTTDATMIIASSTISSSSPEFIATTTSTFNATSTSSTTPSETLIATTTLATTSGSVSEASTSSMSAIASVISEIISTSTLISTSTALSTISSSTSSSSQSTLSITNFAVSGIVMNTLVVPILHFEVSDQSSVTGYLVTNSTTTPSVDDAGWSSVAPSVYVSKSGGSKILYAWVKDSAGNMASSIKARVTIMIFVK